MHAPTLPNMIRAGTSLYNTAKRGDDKAKTHSIPRAGSTRAGILPGLPPPRDARATGVLQSRTELRVSGAVSLTGMDSGVYLIAVTTFPLVT